MNYIKGIFILYAMNSWNSDSDNHLKSVSKLIGINIYLVNPWERGKLIALKGKINLYYIDTDGLFEHAS